MKKILLFMLGVLIALPGIARDFIYEYEGQMLTYTVIDEEAKTCETKEGNMGHSGNSVSGALVIPSVAKDGNVEYAVTSIGSAAFDGCSGLTSVTIPNSVSLIKISAFAYCFSLETFTIEDGQSSIYIDDSALSHADIEHLYIGRNWSSYYNNGAFKESISTVEIGNSVTELPNSAFRDCYRLTTVTIPNSVSSIGSEAFRNCFRLTSVIIPDSVTSIGSQTFEDCSGLTSVTIPNSVSSIGSGAFRNCSGLTSMTIPNSVESIGYQAFSGCSGLTSVIIPESVTSIGNSAFSGCTGLKKSAYPSGLGIPFPTGASIEYPREVAIIEEGFIFGPEKNAIYFAPLSLDGEYIIPSSVNSIGVNAFYGCSGLTSVKATAINPPVMNDNSFEGLYDSAALSVPEEATADYLATPWSLFKNLRIGDSETACHIYETGNLKYMLIPGKTQEDKNLAVVMQGDYSSLTEITIPERFTVSDNGTSARYYVDAIGYKAFSGCSNLATVTFNSRNASRLIGDYAFAGTKISALTIPETVEAIGNYAFNQCSTIGSISVPGSVESIGDYAFNECYSLTDVTLQEGVKTIGDYAFYGSPLKQMNLNEGLVSIGEYAFSAGNNRNAGPIYMPSTLESVGKNAFENFRCEKVNISDLSAWLRINFRQADGNPLHNSYVLCLNGEELTELTIPEDITKVNQFAFYGCSSLNSVTFGENVESIAESAFSGCSDISKVTFNDALQTMGDFVFYNCESIKSVVLPASLTTLGKGAFSGCTSLRNLTVGASLVQCNDDSFENCNFKNFTIADGLNKLKFGGSWDKIGIINLYMGRPIEFVSSEK